MKVLLATKNESKKEYYGNGLKEQGIEVVSLEDLNINEEVEEAGTSPMENALRKALEYNKLAKITTIAIDDGLYIEKFPEEIQPGTNVRRINGKRATDDEMIEYYTSQLEKVGGQSKGTWKKSVAIVLEDGSVSTYNFENSKMFLSKVCEKRNNGYPLDSISMIPKYGKYTAELTDEEKVELRNTQDKAVFDFIKEKLKRN